MKTRCTKFLLSLLAIAIIGIAGFAKVNAYTINVANRSPYGKLSLSGLYIKPTFTTTGIVLNGYTIKVDPYHANSSGEIRVDRICDENGANCKQVSTLGNGGGGGGFWKQLDTSTLSTSGGNYGLSITGNITVRGYPNFSRKNDSNSWVYKIEGTKDGLDIKGATNITGGLTINNYGLTVKTGGLNVSGSSTLNNSLTVKGTTTMNDKLNITYSGLNVTGGATINNGGLTIKTGGIIITGTTTLNNNLIVKGTSEFNNQLKVTLGGMIITGGISVKSGGLSVSNNITAGGNIIGGGLSITGNIALKGHDIAIRTFSGLALRIRDEVQSNNTYKQYLQIYGDTTIYNKNFTVSSGGNTNLQGQLIIGIPNQTGSNNKPIIGTFTDGGEGVQYSRIKFTPKRQIGTAGITQDLQIYYNCNESREGTMMYRRRQTHHYYDHLEGVLSFCGCYVQQNGPDAGVGSCSRKEILHWEE